MKIGSERMVNNDVKIAFAINDNYSPYLAVAIKSILENSNPNRKYLIYILHSSVSDENQKIIKSIILNYANGYIFFVNIANEVADRKFYIGGKEGLTIETYFRLFIPEVLPDIEKIIYLDCDMIVNADLSELYDIELGSNYFASVQDYCSLGKYYMLEATQRYYWDNVLKLNNPENYFCAGMIVMNLKALREDSITTSYLINKALEFNWEKHDQDVLNIIGNGKTKMLPLAWDVLKRFNEIENLPNEILEQIKIAENNPKIIHFSSSYKPWNEFIDRFEFFWRYAVKTPYALELIKRIKNVTYKEYVIRSFLENIKINYLPVKNDVILYEEFNKIYIGKLSNCYTKIFHFEITDNAFKIFGKTMCIGVDKVEDISLYVDINGELIECVLIPADIYHEKKNGIISYWGIGFNVDIPLNNSDLSYEIKFVLKYKNQLIDKENISFGKFANLTTRYKEAYFYKNDRYIKIHNSRIIIKKCNTVQHIKLEISFLTELLLTKKKYNCKAFIARIIYYFCKLFVKKEIWLFSDRANKADDSGEILFRFVCDLNRKDIKPYYIINKRSNDYKRLKKMGNIVDSMSFKHKILHLIAKYNISSQADDNVVLPFYDRTTSYCDIIASKFVFLQHGVIKEDMSNTYNRINQNMSIFVTTAYKEYESIIKNNNYSCDEKITKLTGLPRHDRLCNSESKYITFMPTWRRYLFKHSAEVAGVWVPRDNFIYSDYFNFYNNLLNNEKLIEAAKENGYIIAFMPHPNVQGALPLFHKNPDVEFFTLDKSYKEIYAESGLVITDRSSAVMDFSYLRKPVVYCQFDDVEFMSGGHVYIEGYFDYERDGFGEVCYDEESLIDTLIEYMKNGCKLKDKYRERIDNFFAFNDRNNCQRVYEEILKLEN